MRLAFIFANLFSVATLLGFSQTPRSYEKDVEPIFL